MFMCRRLILLGSARLGETSWWGVYYVWSTSWFLGPCSLVLLVASFGLRVKGFRI